MKIYIEDLEKARSIIRSRDVVIGVVGLGRVGLVVASAFLSKGFKVVGFDRDLERIYDELRLGGHVLHPEKKVREIIIRSYYDGLFSLAELGREYAENVDVFIVIVPVPLSEGFADLRFIEDASRRIGSVMGRGSIVIVESSVPPGTTRGFVKNVLEESSGLRAGRDFGLAYSPERVSIGRAFDDLVFNYPKIVAGYDLLSLEIVSELYSEISLRGVLKASSLEVAELAKLFEGVYRDVNIALANSLAEISRLFGVDFWEVRELANSQPYSNIHAPGTGVGGVCLPYYPYFVLGSLKNLGGDCWCAEIIRLSRSINEFQPVRVVDMIVEGLNELGFKESDDLKISILGLSYRGDIPDSRESPTYRIVREFISRGFRSIYVHDPFIERDLLLEGLGVVLSSDLGFVLRGSNIVLVSTDHSIYRGFTTDDIVRISGSRSILIFDGRNVIKLGEGVRDQEVRCLYGGVGKTWVKC
ncbi:MAG: nucleotide sugar dehydrogenase [Sulfolobales archaeon]